MKWFKHYNDALAGSTMQSLIMDQDYGAIVVYFHLLETMSKLGSGGVVEVDIRSYARAVNMKSGRCMTAVRSLIHHGAKLGVTQTGHKVVFTVFNWAELQENRGGKRQAKQSQNSTEENRVDKNRIEESRIDTVRIPKKQEVESIDSPTNLVKKSFLGAFEKEFGRSYPGWGAKENSQAKMWLKSVSVNKAMELCELYPLWNDPWVTKVGHPFGVLVQQYIQLDAWSKGSRKLIEKIAHGKAVEQVTIANAVSREVSHLGIQHIRERDQQIANLNVRGDKGLRREIPNSPKASLPRRTNSEPREEIYDFGGEGDFGEGGFQA